VIRHDEMSGRAARVGGAGSSRASPLSRVRTKLDRLPNPMVPPGRREWVAGISYYAWSALRHVVRFQRMTLSRSTSVVTVVGSFGKTTTTRTVNAALGLPDHPRTTYSYNSFSRVAFEMFRRPWGATYAVIEVGIGKPGQMGQYADALRPTVAVVTSLGSEHLAAFESPQALRNEKAEMVRSLPANGTAVLNGDDPHVLSMAAETKAQVISFGFGPSNDVFLEDMRIDWPTGMHLTVHVAGREFRFKTQLIGKTMAYPVLAAMATAAALGRDLDQAAAALERLPPTVGRIQPVPLQEGGFVLRDDRKAAMETIHAALDLLREIPAQRRFVVLGDISDPPPPVEARYEAVGRHVAAVADAAVVIGTDAWKFERYRGGAIAGGMTQEQVVFARDIPDAVYLLPTLTYGDVLLVKGRRKEKLTRLILSLAGEPVHCQVAECTLHEFCDTCRHLRRERQHW